MDALEILKNNIISREDFWKKWCENRGAEVEYFFHWPEVKISTAKPRTPSPLTLFVE